MKRDQLLREKDRVQQRMWEEAGKDVSAYVALVHRKAMEMRRSGLKLRYAK